MSIYDVFSGGNRPFDKEEWAAAKQAQRKEAYELIDNTCSEMMASGDSFRQYLNVQGSFDRYSVANAILVSAQMPEATQLKEYSKWKANRVYVNKDAQKIIILEPSKEYTREDGTKGISYNAKVVYDISETSAKDRQQEQEPKSMRELVSALIDASPVPCVPVGELELPAYYDSSQQTIFVKKGLSEEVLFVSMAKEVSAAVYDFKYNESRDASDFKSFCVAKYQKLYLQNEDMVGWISIAGTTINYPVMQSRNNPNFYLKHNFEKEYSYLGTPYVQENCDIAESDNLVIYGHHIKGGKMFGALEDYKSKSFYEEHKNIQFDTLTEQEEYEIVAVFKTVAYSSEGFRYYDFVDAENEEDFNSYVGKCKELALYDTGVTAEYGDRLITLSTCEYSAQNGRLVVVAKKVG